MVHHYPLDGALPLPAGKLWEGEDPHRMVRETRRRITTLRRTGSQGQWRADIRVASRLVPRHVHSSTARLQRRV